MSELFEASQEVEIPQQQPTKNYSERAKDAGKALADSRDAFELSQVQATSEDIRALAISFLIGQNKRENIKAIREDKPVAQGPKKEYVKLPFLDIQDGVEYTVKIISDDGEYKTERFTTHGFTVEIKGELKKLSTMSKKLLHHFVVDAVVTFRRYNEDNFTKYEVK